MLEGKYIFILFHFEHKFMDKHRKNYLLQQRAHYKRNKLNLNDKMYNRLNCSYNSGHQKELSKMGICIESLQYWKSCQGKSKHFHWMWHWMYPYIESKHYYLGKEYNRLYYNYSKLHCIKLLKLGKYNYFHFGHKYFYTRKSHSLE